MEKNFFTEYDLFKAKHRLCQFCELSGLCFEDCYMVKETVNAYNARKEEIVGEMQKNQ